MTCKADNCKSKVLVIRGRRGERNKSMPLCIEHWREQGLRHATRSPDGSRSKKSDGYIQIKCSGKWMPEHRAIMECILGRALRAGETVHHKNGIRDDNSPGNLELWVGSIRSGQRACDLICPHCSKPYVNVDNGPRKRPVAQKAT